MGPWRRETQALLGTGTPPGQASERKRCLSWVLSLLAQRDGGFADRGSRHAIFFTLNMEVLRARISISYHVHSPLCSNLACLFKEQCSCWLSGD